jgi:hypothetical protein
LATAGLDRSRVGPQHRIDLVNRLAKVALPGNLGALQLAGFLRQFTFNSLKRLPVHHALPSHAVASGCAASRQGSHTLNLRGFRHAAVEGAEHQVLLTVSIEAQADERCSVELLSAILALNRALHPDG